MLKIAYAPIYQYDLPEGHRFPMVKYELIREQLLYEGAVGHDNFFHPERLPEPVAMLTHTQEYWDKLIHLTLSRSEERAIGFPITHQFIERGRHISAGTVQCMEYAQQYGVAMNVAGGTHHAFADRGEGFCCLNDQAVAANYLLSKAPERRILVIDLDVHQGNGTASIFAHEERVFTFSMHGERNYPLRKETSDLDVGLPDGIEDDAYLELLRTHLVAIGARFRPDFVFYQSGVDVLATDKLGKLALSRHGCRLRDRTVFEWCRGQGLPVVVCMGGGYSPRLVDIVEAHANTFREAIGVYF
jgi:acetoin utilization deacetylase AcuC-like enzyme